jgi:hypothetical protein
MTGNHVIPAIGTRRHALRRPTGAPTRYRRDTDTLQSGNLAHPEPRHDH